VASQLAIALQMSPRRRLRRPRVQRFPLNIERQYAARLRTIAQQTIDLVNQRIVSQLDRWALDAGVRTDQAGDWVDQLEAEFTIIRRDLQTNEAGYREVATTVARETSGFNLVEVGRQMSGVVGGQVLPLSDDEDVIKGFINQNVQAIKSIPAQHLDQVERIITEGFRGGRRAETLKKEIADRGGVTLRRANFIARDQISTLNSQLTQRRQRSLGIDQYIWRTSLDERVRHTHAQLEGTTHSWDDPPQVGARRVHPGEDYNCRCTPEPVIEGLEPEETGPEDVPPPLPRPRRRARATARRTRTPAREARRRAAAHPAAGRIRDIPTSAEPITIRLPRSGKTITLTGAQALRARVATALSNYETRQAATTPQRLDRLLWSWVHGKRTRTVVEMRKAAAREFNLRGVVYNTKGFRIDERDVAQSAKDLRFLYNATQAFFRDNGQRQVKVYRGVKAGRAGRGAIESWTTSQSVAEKFAGREGHVITETVPVERVLTVRGGPYWLDGRYGNQGEIVVMY